MATSTRPGDLLARRYRLVDLLTESGGGRFWRAHDLVLERNVALHVIAEGDPRAPDLVEAARESARVLDSRILRVLDAETRDGLCFVVNEWGTGTSLDILVTQAGPLGPRRGAWLAADVASAIATAHAAGVVHGRLNPENVLIDRRGAVRLIGLCVDAALYGVRDRDVATDVGDLAGILYCGLTGTWPGPSESIVPAAPHAHGHVLAPRRVRAGVPRPLDQLWREIVEPADVVESRLRRHPDGDVTTAAGIATRLLNFLGDPIGLPEALAASIPPINDVKPVVLPSVADPLPHERDVVPEPEPEREPERETAETVVVPTAVGVADEDAEAHEAGQGAETAGSEEAATAVTEAPPIPTVADLPTEPGMPVFGEDDDDVAWLRARSTPPPPPPPFEEPPERPLFAPDPPAGEPVRRPRTDVPTSPIPPPPLPPPAAGGSGYWPWNVEPPPDPITGDIPADEEVVPGRSWLRLAMGIAAVLLLMLAVVVAFNLGRGRTPLGRPVDPTTSPTASGSPSTPAPTRLTGLTTSDFDPFGGADGENPEATSNTVDGDPSSTWPTSTYNEQFGPGGLKPGVGLLLDLGRERSVAAIDATFVGAPTTIQMYVSDTAPTAAPTGEPLAESTASGTEATLEPEEAATGRYVLLWVVSLPSVSEGYRAELAEVVVRGQ